MKIRTLSGVAEFKGKVYNVPGVPGFVVHKQYDDEKWWSISHFNSGCHVFSGDVTKKETITGFKSWIDIHYKSVEHFTNVVYNKINERGLTELN